MSRNPLNHIVRWVVLLLVQALFANHIALDGYATPQVYILFILMLPLDAPAWVVLISSFLLGLGVDMFSNTGGMHAMAATLIAFLRPYIVALIAPAEGYEPEDEPKIQSLGFRWFALYAALGTIVHHLLFFTLEIMSFAHPSYLFSRMGWSALFTWVLLILIQLLFSPVRVKKGYG